ncbi:NUDIX hydrolase [Bacillus alkalicellulosilyticus]|uniref:NUDIX hydrolase n=1 Tax=Alkalihalobacterium alkalicellulosilyticum TaxID=1912214 RepID=UPI000997D142|nr:NUDIX domain-containing protein [Bacillus alkalicellulosilyticus]
MGIVSFGAKEKGVTYLKRPAVYSVILTEGKDKIAIIHQNTGKFFLPGGGIEKGETHEQCLKREALEEIGSDILIGQFLGCAHNYFYSTIEFTHYLSIGYFYKCELGDQVSEPTEEGNFFQWVEVNSALSHLFLEHQSWGVRQALTND